MPKTTHSVYFSATNMSKTYVNFIAKSLGLPVSEHDVTGPAWDSSPRKIGRDEIVVFGAPVFGGRIPALAARRFRLFKGEGGPAIVLTSYGNRAYDDALLELKDLAEELGFVVIGAAAPVGRHSLLPHNAAYRPDAGDLDEAVIFAKNCLAKLEKKSLDAMPALKVSGNRPYKENPPAPWFPYGTDDCNNCQTCVRLCPVEAIPAEDPKSTAENCFRCGRCLAVCPQGARQIPSAVFAMLRERIDPLASGHKPSYWFV